MSTTYLPAGLPIPVPESDGLSRPYWEGLKREELWVQRCSQCQTWQWGPEWICHHCLSFEVGWAQVEGKGRIYSWERVWHPVHPALQQRRDWVVTALRGMGYETTNPEGTFYVMAKAPIADDMAFGALLADHGVLVLPGTVVEAPGWFRISLTASDEMVERGLPGFETARVAALDRSSA